MQNGASVPCKLEVIVGQCGLKLNSVNLLPTDPLPYQNSSKYFTFKQKWNTRTKCEKQTDKTWPIGYSLTVRNWEGGGCRINNGKHWLRAKSVHVDVSCYNGPSMLPNCIRGPVASNLGRVTNYLTKALPCRQMSGRDCSFHILSNSL